jgi:basic amino acid/polyamine antiporter, APA family
MTGIFSPQNGTPDTRLARRLNTADAVMIGLGAMIGAGIFAAMAPAAEVAGTGILISLSLAGFLAYLNAMAMSQLAVLYPESGGAYVYGRKRLGPLWGFLAGWGFVIGKIASCTAMALTFAHYAFPAHSRLAAVLAVAALTTINYLGIKKTAGATRLIVGIVVASLLVTVFASLAGGSAEAGRLTGWLDSGGAAGILEATGLLFFAFAGYARLATLGEEVIEPTRTIPRAVKIALGITLALYSVVAVTLVLCLDIETLALSKAPLAAAIEAGEFSQLSPVVRIGAAVASVGVLLSLLAGVGRTVFAMAANGDLPKSLSHVHQVHRTPYIAEALVSGIVILILTIADIRSAIGFSSFAILFYYAIANLIAWTLKQDERKYPKWLAGAGLAGCLSIAFSLPSTSVIGGIALFAVGAIYYAVFLRARTKSL